MKKERRRRRRLRAKLRAVDQLNEEIAKLQECDARLAKKFKAAGYTKAISR